MRRETNQSSESTVANLIVALKCLPQDAIVELRDTSGSGYEVDVECIHVFDYTDDMYKGSSLFGKLFVELEAK